jgi:folate-dependent phosphoribosylglycinamide formyltransferase PurN
MHGHHVHEAVHSDFNAGLVKHTGVTMHFATPEYDSTDGMFFRKHVRLELGDTPDSIASRVNAIEHEYQARVTNLVVTGQISWDGKNPASMRGAMIDEPEN